MSAVVRSGRVIQLDRQVEPQERLTEEQVKDAPWMARLLMRILRDVALLRRRFWPRSIDHEDVVVADNTGTTLYRLPHGLNQRVRWFVVDWSGASGGPQLVRDDASNYDTLVLRSYEAGTVTVRIEEAG